MYCHFCYFCNMKHRLVHIRLAHQLIINSIQRNDTFSRSTTEVCTRLYYTVLCYILISSTCLRRTYTYIRTYVRMYVSHCQHQLSINVYYSMKFPPFACYILIVRRDAQVLQGSPQDRRRKLDWNSSQGSMQSGKATGHHKLATNDIS